MTVVLPTPELNPGKAEWSEVYANDKALKEAVEALQATAKPLTWYTPKIIAPKETRESASYGTLTTKDEITNIVLPENGVLMVAYRAYTKTTVASAGRVALFLSSFEVSAPNGESEVTATSPASTSRRQLRSSDEGFVWPNSEAATADQTAGQVAAPFMPIFAAAGTYSLSVRWAATSGSISVEERKLWAYVLGT